MQLDFKINIQRLEEAIKSIVKDAIHDAMPAKNKSRLIDTKQACEILGVSKRTLQGYRDRGIIPFCKIGTKVLYDEADLLNAIKAFQATSPVTYQNSKK